MVVVNAQKRAQRSTPIVSRILQRKCDKCRRNKITLQRSAFGPAPETAPPIVHKVLRSPGAPLDAQTREFMEPRFGHDFSRVRVHTGSAAERSARDVNALAYTVGSHIVFGSRQYKPGTSAGNRLLVHELAHTIQQREVHPLNMKPLYIGAKNDASERISSHLADQLASGVLLKRMAPGGVEPVLQRACGPAEIGGVGGCIARGGDIADFGESSDSIYLFNVNCDDFALGERARLEAYAGSIAFDDRVDIDGFASEEGEIGFNENLSCARAKRAQEVISVATGVQTAIYKHGATPGDRPTHRSAIITIHRPETETEVTPSYRCGPDVTQQVQDAVHKTRTRFGTWTPAERNDACQALISLRTGGFAWDIVNLHNNSWILSYRPECATAGAQPPCGSTIEVDGECSYAGSPNYVIYGVMMKLCRDHYAALGNQSDADDFTRAEMLGWINFYKGTGPLGISTPSGNFGPSQDWAEAGYDGWPAASSPHGDRTNCHPSCPTAYDGQAFLVRWHPHGVF